SGGRGDGPDTVGQGRLRRGSCPAQAARRPARPRFAAERRAAGGASGGARRRFLLLHRVCRCASPSHHHDHYDHHPLPPHRLPSLLTNVDRSAGTGKSFLLKEMITQLRRKHREGIFVTASTVRTRTLVTAGLWLFATRQDSNEFV